MYPYFRRGSNHLTTPVTIFPLLTINPPFRLILSVLKFYVRPGACRILRRDALNPQSRSLGIRATEATESSALRLISLDPFVLLPLAGTLLTSKRVTVPLAEITAIWFMGLTKQLAANAPEMPDARAVISPVP